MTREEFIQAHSIGQFGRLMRAMNMDKNSGLSLKWLMAQGDEIERWLGGLHDTLTEMLNASQQKQPQGKSGAASGSGPVPKAPSSRNAG